MGSTRLPSPRGRTRPVTHRTGAAITEQRQPPVARPRAARPAAGLAPRPRDTSVLTACRAGFRTGRKRHSAAGAPFAAVVALPLLSVRRRSRSGASRCHPGAPEPERLQSRSAHQVPARKGPTVGASPLSTRLSAASDVGIPPHARLQTSRHASRAPARSGTTRARGDGSGSSWCSGRSRSFDAFRDSCGR